MRKMRKCSLVKSVTDLSKKVTMNALIVEQFSKMKRMMNQNHLAEVHLEELRQVVEAPTAPSGEPGKENLPLAVEARSTSAAPVKFATTVINHLSRPVHIPKPREMRDYSVIVL